MRTRFTRVMAGLAALAALALGGSAIAGAAQHTKPAPVPAVAEQQGSAKVDNDSLQQENGADDATEAATGEAAESGTESAGEAAESGSEQAGDDGPGGHADEPGNANADHQFEGKE